MKWIPLSTTSQLAMLNNLLQPLLRHPSSQLAFYAPIFQLLTGQNHLRVGRQLHAHMALRGLKPNAFLATKMVAMYASSSDINSAFRLFSTITHPSRLLFNAMIRAFTIYREYYNTIGVYCQMHSLGLLNDYFTFPFVLKASADLSCMELGKSVHGLSLRSGLDFDIYVGTSLINMYVKCGDLVDAKLFDEMPFRDVSSWNALIAGYMKAGLVNYARELFERMRDQSIVSWTSMISGYTQNGFVDKAMRLFDEIHVSSGGLVAARTFDEGDERI